MILTPIASAASWSGEGEMGVARSGCRLGMSQQGANNREAQTVRGANAGITVPKIVQTEAIDLGYLAYSFPALSQREDRLPRSVTRKSVFCSRLSGQRADKLGARRR
jgi:hypothetical protein